jgi:amidohydrolase
MSNELVRDIQNQAMELFPSIVELRRELHAHPELSFQETVTSGKIKAFLQQQNILFTEGWAGFGIVATIEGAGDGPVVMLRADMDALPIQEENELPFKSTQDGIMHACGHDVHTSSLLGTAALINKNKALLKGNVVFIFQPGEEKLPGGASIMIKEGLLTKTKPEWIAAQHVYPILPAGHVGFRSGLYMASADEIYITIRGKGGHAATPHQCIDPIVIASGVVLNLQELVSRRINPLSPVVLSIGKINSVGGATNIIPDEVKMEGTLRMMNEPERFAMHDTIRQLVVETCNASGATGHIEILTGYPSLRNDDVVTALCRQSAQEYLGEDKVHDLPQRMTSEDFAFYTLEIPGTFYRLGTGWDDPARDFPVHSSRFTVNEDALLTGMGLMAYITLSRLS